MNSTKCLFYILFLCQRKRTKRRAGSLYCFYASLSATAWWDKVLSKKKKIQMSILGNSHPSHSIRDTQGTLALCDLAWRFTPHPTSLFYSLWWHYALRFSSSKWGFYLKPSLLQEILLRDLFRKIGFWEKSIRWLADFWDMQMQWAKSTNPAGFTQKKAPYKV